MEISKYLNGKQIKIDLKNGYFYQGKIISRDKDSITIEDKTGKLVTISINAILFIREVQDAKTDSS